MNCPLPLALQTYSSESSIQQKVLGLLVGLSVSTCCSCLFVYVSALIFYIIIVHIIYMCYPLGCMLKS